MDIKVLGTGCANCKATIALIDQIAQAKGCPATEILICGNRERKIFP